ncbi:MAG: elongation factor G [Bacteroidota bacterium]
MKVYDADHVRNVALVGHQGSGKTSLAEAMLYASGAVQRMGTVEEQNTVSDYHPSEHEREMSIFTSLLHAEWKGHKINILDTPGYLDFVGEVVTALKVADTAIFVLDAAEGVQVGTEQSWRYCEQTGTPSMFVINKLDQDNADFGEIVRQMHERFGRAATVVQLPGGAGTRSVIDVLLMKQLTFDDKGKATESEIDDAFRDEAQRLHNELVENIAENDEALMELYFEKGELTEDEMRQGLREAMIKRDLFPIFLTISKENVGVSRLMGFIDNVCPAPPMMPPAQMDEGEASYDPAAEPIAFVYRTMAEQHVGEYSFFRVHSGTLEPNIDLENAQTGASERLGQLFVINGHERDSVTKLVAGDLGAAVKLRGTATNHTLRRKGSNAVRTPITFPEPRMRVAIRTTKSGDEDKLAQGLNQLHKEDPALHIEHDASLGQMTLAGQGEQHLDVARYRLKNRFGVEVEFDRPKVAYRETVQGRARASYRHKKQTGGAGQFADISLLVEPLNGEFQPPDDIKVRNVEHVTTEWGSTIEYIDGIVGGVIDMRRFFGAIQKGINDALREGPVAGYPVGDVRVVVYDGGMHAVDSNENAFKTAARYCFRDAFREAKAVILEPVYNLEVLVPEDHMGDVLGDLNTRRARVQGMEAEGPFQKVIAQVPEAELYRYSTSLRSMTQGRGLHHAEFDRYDAMPRHVQEEVIAQGAALEEA